MNNDQFMTLKAKLEAQSHSTNRHMASIASSSKSLRLFETYNDVIQRPVDLKRRINGTVLHVGFGSCPRGSRLKSFNTCRTSSYLPGFAATSCSYQCSPQSKGNLVLQ
ncbi:hypothetical protein ACFX2I_024551 [Malus domestica]